MQAKDYFRFSIFPNTFLQHLGFLGRRNRANTKPRHGNEGRSPEGFRELAFAWRRPLVRETTVRLVQRYPGR